MTMKKLILIILLSSLIQAVSLAQSATDGRQSMELDYDSPYLYRSIKRGVVNWTFEDLGLDYSRDKVLAVLFDEYRDEEMHTVLIAIDSTACLLSRFGGNELTKTDDQYLLETSEDIFELIKQSLPGFEKFGYRFFRPEPGHVKIYVRTGDEENFMIEVNKEIENNTSLRLLVEKYMLLRKSLEEKFY